jgi:hypothetical protein
MIKGYSRNSVHDKDYSRNSVHDNGYSRNVSWILSLIFTSGQRFHACCVLFFIISHIHQISLYVTALGSICAFNIILQILSSTAKDYVLFLTCLSPLVALTGFSWSHGEAFNDVDSDVAKHLFLNEIFKYNMVTCRFCHEELSKVDRIFLGDIFSVFM